MTKRLVVPFLVIGMSLWGCSSSSTKKDGAATGGTGGGTGGTGGAGTGGTGGAGTGGTGGIRLDGAPADAPRDTAPPADGPRQEGGTVNLDGRPADTAAAETGAAADFCTGYTMGMNIAAAGAAAFCTKYDAVCMFGAMPKYINSMDCMMRYLAAPDNGVCRTNHLCNANISAAMAATHCPHALGSATPAPNPCVAN